MSPKSEATPTSPGGPFTEAVKTAAAAVQQDVPRSAQLSETGQAVLEDIQKVASVSQRIVTSKIEPAFYEAQEKGTGRGP